MKTVKASLLALAGFALLAVGLTGCAETAKVSTPAPAKEVKKEVAPVAKPATPLAPAVKDPAAAKPKDHPAH